MRDTQRVSELHGKEKREERVRGDLNEMKWNIIVVITTVGQESPAVIGHLTSVSWVTAYESSPLWGSAFKWVYLSFSPLLFTSLLFKAICKASPDSHFAFLHKRLVSVNLAASCVG